MAFTELDVRGREAVHYSETGDNIEYQAEEKISFQTGASLTYSIQIQHAKRREIINLRTANKEEAGTLARNFYRESLRFGRKKPCAVTRAFRRQRRECA